MREPAEDMETDDTAGAPDEYEAENEDPEPWPAAVDAGEIRYTIEHVEEEYH